MSRELDATVAEVMGWHWDDDWGCLIPPEQTAKPREMWTDWQTDGIDTWREPIKGHAVSGIVYNGNFTKVILPEYSAGIAAARTMEDWIAAQNGVWWRYAHAMDVVLLEDGGIASQNEEDYAWALLRATPEQRCRAFLKAMGVEVENES